MSKEIAEEYASSLSDLTVNSKPLINMLTILAEENIDHAGVIVDTVERHLEKVHADIKLPVLYLVDSIIKNVGGAYTQKFSQSIVNMFTRTFKQVDEKVRSQMFKLRETWHDVFPATKLYQLDVKVNLIDPAWPIQAQPQPAGSIHPAATTSAAPPAAEEEKMRSILAKKEQELLMLQRKKIEIELEKTRRALEIAASTNTKALAPPVPPAPPAMPVAMVSPTRAPPPEPAVSVKQRLGPPVIKPASGARIAPVSAALAAARRDPRLARRAPPAPAAPAPAPAAATAPAAPIAPHVFDIKPLERVTKRSNVITIDVRPDRPDHARNVREPRADPRKEKRDRKFKHRKPDVVAASVDSYADTLRVVDPKRITDLPPIPKINREAREAREEPAKRKKEPRDKKKKRESAGSKESSESSPEKKPRGRKVRAPEPEPAPPAPAAPAALAAPEPVAFKELRNYHPERYRPRARSGSAEPAPDTSAPEVAENKDVDLRVLPPAVSEAKAAPVGQKRSSTEALEGKAKKNKLDKFDILFGNEDVDLRQLPQVEEAPASPPPPPPPPPPPANGEPERAASPAPAPAPNKDWTELKERDDKKTPSKLDLVRAKLAEATKGKDRLGRPFLFSKSPSIERERRRTLSTEDVDLRPEHPEEFDAEDHKKTISIIMNQAKEQFSDGQLDKNQYNKLMYQVLQLNEKLKLKEAKQRESLEISKRRLKAHIDGENHKAKSPESSPTGNRFGDIDERVIPAPFPADGAPAAAFAQDSDMRPRAAGPLYPPPAWRPYRPRADGVPALARRPRGVVPPFFRGTFEKRAPRFEPRMPFPQPLPTPKVGTRQGECPLPAYARAASPPPLGAPGAPLPSTSVQALEYIDRDPVKTIQIDGVPREIRFYGDTAVVMLDWDDPREIRFLPGSRRVTFDNKDSVVLNFNEEYRRVEVDDQVFDIRFGAPTRELFINGRWHECFFGGAPLGVIIDGKPRLIHLEGPLPQVDIGKVKRTDLVAGKINLIVDATQMCPIFLDAKVQKFTIDGQCFTIRFVDALRTVLINEQPFQVEFGGLPRPIFIGNEKHFIRFSVLPRHVRPGHDAPAGMQGEEARAPAPAPALAPAPEPKPAEAAPALDPAPTPEPARPVKTPSPDVETNQGGLDMLASLMPSSMAPASASDYSSAPAAIPGLEAPPPAAPAAPAPAAPALDNIDDLFAKLLASGIIKVPTDTKPDKEERVEEKRREDRTVVHRVDLKRPETLRVAQPALVSRLYGGMQCSGCGARFPPEHTVRYSQHLDWHFRQNRRERDSARRAHSRHWHYDLADWVQYEELEDLEERAVSWFERENGPAAARSPPPAAAPSEPAAGAAAGSDAGSAAGPPARPACALCGDHFDQFYNDEREEWHLRNSVLHDGLHYHPLCLEDYKASLTKEEPPKEEAAEVAETTAAAEETETIEIADVEDAAEPSDDESVVEVIDADKPVEIDDAEEPEERPPSEADDDDVVFKAEPVEQVLVEDQDTDDETSAARGERDRAADFARVRVKQEPLDPDDEPIITAEEEAIRAAPDTSRAPVLSSIDGNVQLAAPAPAAAAPIRINISKPPAEPAPAPAPAPPPSDLDDVSADEEPPPPGEEPEMEYKLKPQLEGVAFSRQPPVQRGSELSGLCSIM